MRAPDLAAAIGPSARTLRLRAYRSLAYALAATRSPAGVVFESTAEDVRPRLTFRPRSILETVRADPFGGSVPFEEIRPPAARAPPTGWPDRLFAIVPASVPARWPWSRPTIVGATPPGARAFGPGGWAAFQTFWVRRRSGELAIARRARLAAPTAEALDRLETERASGIAAEWADATGVPSEARRLGVGARRDWNRGATRTLPPNAWLFRNPERVAGTAEVRLAAEAPAEPPREHAIVFGASGAGKTTYLAARARSAIARGDRIFAIDLHGDLGPAIVEGLPEPERARLLAVDAADRPVPGIAALVPGGDAEERAAAQLVAALKRLTPDGTDLYWGFRLERIFDTFVRLVLESGGSILDLYGLLTDPRRRDAARWGTRRDDLAAFLDELAPVLKRNPEFLWSAATRLSKVVLVPALGELLAPAGGGLAVEELIGVGRSLLVRLPIADLGPEAASFAAALVLGRVYLGLVARAARDARPIRVWIVLDEAHGFPPKLVTEILTEGRKFGVSALLATQYPERLAPEARAAAAGALATCVTFRVPRSTSREVGEWFGLSAPEAVALLPGLPTGRSIVVDADGPGVLLGPEVPRTPAGDPGVWRRVVERTRAEFPFATDRPDRGPSGPASIERLLLRVLGAEEEGADRSPAEILRTTIEPGEAPEEIARLDDALRTVVRRRWVTVGADGCRLTPAGEEALGLGAPTGASRESGEHRALLLRAFRVFARRGCRLEIVRQGRFDTTLPDARYRQLPIPSSRSTPRELAETLDRIRSSWAWRYFGGRDVAVEAEVSGAFRRERIRRGWRKAEARGAFALFLVGDAARARRVRSVLRELGAGPEVARVWTLAGTPPAPRGEPPTNG